MPAHSTPDEIDVSCRIYEEWNLVCDMLATWVHDNIIAQFHQIAPHRPHIPDIGREIRHNHLLRINVNHLALPATMLYAIQRSYNPTCYE